MNQTERPVALTLRKADIKVTPIGNHAVNIINISSRTSVVVFYVGAKEAPPNHAAVIQLIKAVAALTTGSKPT